MTATATRPTATPAPADLGRLRRTWRQSLVVHPGNAGHADLGVALRAGLTVLATLVLVALTGNRDLAAFASLGAIVSVYGRLDDSVARLARVGGAGVLQVATMLVTSAAAWLVGGSATVEAWLVPLLLGLVAAGAAAGAAWLRTGAPGPTLVVFAAAGGLAGAPVGADVLHRTTATGVGVLLALVVAALPAARVVARRTRAGAPVAPPLPAVPPWRTVTARTGLGALVAAAAAQLFGFGHPGWAAVGATAVLQAASRSHVVVRGLHRGVGTAAGALVAWALLDAHLPFWALVVVVAVLQCVTELVVVRHYGLAMLTVTPMALLMSSLGSGGDAGALAGDRAVDTLLGVVLGVLALLVVPSARRTA